MPALLQAPLSQGYKGQEPIPFCDRGKAAEVALAVSLQHLSSCWGTRGQPEAASVRARTAAPPEAPRAAAALSQPGWNSRAPDGIYYCTFLLIQLLESQPRQETPQQHLEASAQADLPLPG